MEYELKYIVTNHKLHSVIDLVSAVCRPNKSYKMATIYSIYFDSIDLQCLRAKINSDYYKSKYRLRWYMDNESGELSEFAYMEVKWKIGSLRQKKRISIEINPRQLMEKRLEDYQLRKIPHMLGNVGVIPAQHLFPAMLIQYNRRRYIEPVSGCGISIDSDICARQFNQNLLPNANSSVLQNLVIESKGKLIKLPQNLASLTCLGARKSSFSKYLGCYARSHNIVFDPR